MNKKYLLTGLCFLTVFFSCGSSTATTSTDETTKTENKTENKTNNTQVVNNNPSQTDQAKVDDELIQKYLKDNDLKAEKDPSGVYYIIEKAGGEQKPTMNDQLTVHYHGTLLDGTVFDSSVERGEPIDFPLGGVVKGWQIGIPKFGKGGKGTLLIPSELAYGARARGKIPANAVLRFDVEVIDFMSREDYTAAQQAKAREAEKTIIADMEKYIKDKGLKAEKDESGLYWVVEKAGSAEKPTVASNVKVHYHGTLLDGTVFDSSVERGEPIEFPLGNVIKGWQLGIPKFGKGGKGKLIIPPSLGYGNRPAGKIPPNSALVFDVELLDF